MKKSVLLLLLVLGSCVQSDVSVRAAQVQITRFERVEIVGINAYSAFKVEIIPAEETKVEIEFPQEIESYMELSVSSEGILNLGVRNASLNRSRDMVIAARVYVKELSHIKAAGASDITIASPLHCALLIVELSGASRLKGEVKAENQFTLSGSGASDVTMKVETRLLRCTGSSSSNISIEGDFENSIWELSGASKGKATGGTREATISAGGASSFAGESFDIETATLRASGASKITVGPITNLSADASSASSIRYKGATNTQNIKTSSAGTIRSY